MKQRIKYSMARTNCCAGLWEPSIRRLYLLSVCVTKTRIASTRCVGEPSCNSLATLSCRPCWTASGERRPAMFLQSQSSDLLSLNCGIVSSLAVPCHFIRTPSQTQAASLISLRHTFQATGHGQTYHGTFKPPHVHVGLHQVKEDQRCFFKAEA